MKLRTVLISAAIAAMGASAFAQSTMDSSPKPVTPAAAPAPAAMPKQMPAEKHKVAKTAHKKHVAKKTMHKQKAMPVDQKAAG
jgi:hypothetical protein